MMEARQEMSCRAASRVGASGTAKTGTVTSGTLTSGVVSSSSGNLTETEPLTESLVFGAESAVTLELGSLFLVAGTCNEAVTMQELVTDAASGRTVSLCTSISLVLDCEA